MLKQATDFSSKDIGKLDIRIDKILDKFKGLDITIEEIITIKLLNSFGRLFETYLTILIQKAKDKYKLPDIQALLSNLKDEEYYIKQTIKVNFIQSHTTSSGSGFT